MTIAGVIEAYSRILSQWTSQTPPVLVIDEANVLMGWDSGKGDLDTLIRFFVHVSKASQQSHVVLATSECAFLHWLSNGGWLAGWGVNMTD